MYTKGKEVRVLSDYNAYGFWEKILALENWQAESKRLE